MSSQTRQIRFSASPHFHPLTRSRQARPPEDPREEGDHDANQQRNEGFSVVGIQPHLAANFGGVHREPGTRGRRGYSVEVALLDRCRGHLWGAAGVGAKEPAWKKYSPEGRKSSSFRRTTFPARGVGTGDHSDMR